MHVVSKDIQQLICSSLHECFVGCWKQMPFRLWKNTKNLREDISLSQCCEVQFSELSCKFQFQCQEFSPKFTIPFYAFSVLIHCLGSATHLQDSAWNFSLVLKSAISSLVPVFAHNAYTTISIL